MMIRQSIVLITLYICGVSCLKSYSWSEVSCPPRDAKLLTRDTGADWGHSNHALYTLPPEVTLEISPIPNANLGIISTSFIRRFTWLGSYEGVVVTDAKDISDYAWVVYRGGERSHYVDGGSTATSNWLRWINCPRHIGEENVWMTSCKDRVYYITSKDVQPGDELLVYYGDKYFKHLGLDPEVFYSKNATVSRCGSGLCCKDQIVFKSEL